VDAVLSHKHYFTNPDRTWITELTYSTEYETEYSHFREQLYDDDFTPSSVQPELQYNIDDEMKEVLSFQSDLVLPLSESYKFEAGLKAQMETNDMAVYVENFDYASNSYLPDSTLINRFVQDQQTYAGYVTFAGVTRLFGYQLGVRAEQVYGTSTLVNTGEVFPNNYLSFFPSVHLKRDVGEGRDVKLSYSRRINRPWGFSMNPFPDLNDPVVMRIGNPLLQPEYVNSFELGYSTVSTSLSANASVYYRRTQNLVTRYTTVVDGVSVNQPLNLGVGDAYGAELFARFTINRWWNANASINMFQSFVYGEIEGVELRNDGLGWFTRAGTNVTLPADLQLQLTANYSGPVTGLQGYMKPRFTADAGLRKELADKKIQLALAVTDIFDTHRFGGISSGENFYQDVTRKRQSRIIMFTANWFFGQQEQKRNPQRENNMGMPIDDF
jgi:hypothetical protein